MTTPTRTFSATAETVHAALLAALPTRTIAEIATAAGIHWTALSRFKSRQREIGTAGLESLAAALGLEVAALDQAAMRRARSRHAAYMRNVAKAEGTPLAEAFEKGAES